VDSVPEVVERINNAFTRADEIQWSKGVDPGDAGYIDYLAPIVADAEAGFGGVLNAFELMKAMIRAGAGGVHFEDQLASVKKCGHMGGKVLVPTTEACQKLIAARMAADVMRRAHIGDRPHRCGSRRPAHQRLRCQRQAVPDRRAHCRRFLQDQERPGPGHCTRQWPTPSTPTWCGAKPARPTCEFAKKFADAVHAKHPGKLLAYNCSPSFNWKKNLDDATIAKFQKELGAMGYKYQFITLAGIHNMWYHMFDLAQDYVARGMSAYVDKVQEPEFAGARARLHLRVAPARGGHRLLRRSDHRDPGRQVQRHRADRLHRGRAVPLSAARKRQGLGRVRGASPFFAWCLPRCVPTRTRQQVRVSVYLSRKGWG